MINYIQWLRINESVNENYSIGKREDIIIDYIKKSFSEIDDINGQINDDGNLLIIYLNDPHINIMDIQIMNKKLNAKIGNIFDFESGVNHDVKRGYYALEVDLKKLYSVPNSKIEQIKTYNNIKYQENDCVSIEHYETEVATLILKSFSSTEQRMSNLNIQKIINDLTGSECLTKFSIGDGYEHDYSVKKTYELIFPEYKKLIRAQLGHM